MGAGAFRTRQEQAPLGSPAAPQTSLRRRRHKSQLSISAEPRWAYRCAISTASVRDRPAGQFLQCAATRRSSGPRGQMRMPVQSRLVDERDHGGGCRHQCADDGRPAPVPTTRAHAPHGSRQLAHERAMPAAVGPEWHPMLTVAGGQRLGQRGNGDIPLRTRDGADGWHGP